MSKTIVVGDVHGCIDELHELLVKCEYNEYLDHLVFVGDLVGKVSVHPLSTLHTLLLTLLSLFPECSCSSPSPILLISLLLISLQFILRVQVGIKWLSLHAHIMQSVL